MPSERAEIEALKAEVKRLGDLVLLVNDASFIMAGLLSRVAVNAGITTREALADEIEHRAGAREMEDHNPLLLAFARAVRMNFPGGSFEVIEGGKAPPVDHEPT